MNKYRLIYTRTLTLEKTIEAENWEAADKQGQEIEEGLSNSNFDDADAEFEIEELKMERGARVEVKAEGKHKGDRGTVWSMMPYLRDETLQRYGMLYLDANETFCVIPDTWNDEDAMLAKGWR